jgi:hypothetical protein
LGFKIENSKLGDIAISKDDLEKSKQKIVKLIDKECKVLFGMKKMTITYIEKVLGTDEDTNKKFLGFEINIIQKSVKIKWIMLLVCLTNLVTKKLKKIQNY